MGITTTEQDHRSRPRTRPYDVAEFLAAHEDEVLDAARRGLARARLPHYDDIEVDVDERLRPLLDVVIEACRGHRLDEVEPFADSLAFSRQVDGFPLAEVQVAVNVVEEAVWRAITSEIPPTEQAYALGLVATVFGRIKDRLACGYLARLAQHRSDRLRVDLLFQGSEGSNPAATRR